MTLNGHILSAQSVLNIEISALEAGRDAIDQSFSQAVELLRGAAFSGRIIVMGMGKSGHIGNKIAATLASTGSPAFFVHPAEAGHGDLGMITKNDIVLALSQSGKSDEILRLIPYFRRNGIRVLALTGDSSSPLATYANVTISTSVPKEACPLGLAPTASTTLALALGDALAVCLLQDAGFTETDFAGTHPHGSLGRRLLVCIRDVMQSLAETATVMPGTTIKDALVTMTKGSMGFAVIVKDGKPVGVFTDGDLRRCLDQDIGIRTTKISEVMTTPFSSVGADELAVAAVDLMEKHKVSALPVLDDNGDLVGAINMRQLLQAGVV